MVTVILPDLEFTLAKSLIDPTINVIKEGDEYNQTDIIFNMSGKKLKDCMDLNYNLLWEENDFCNSLFKNAKPLSLKNKITVIISTYKRLELLKAAVLSILNGGYPNFEIIIVGDCCPVLDTIFFDDPRIKVYNMTTNSNDGGCTPKNFGISLVKQGWITYLDDDNYYLKHHLVYFYHKMCISEATYGISSIIMGKYNIICKEPKLYRVDTSCIIHKKELIDKYGKWKSHKEAGYYHDYELVSRWKTEPYFVTEKPTVWYNLKGSLNNPKVIYEYYGDQ